MVAVGAARSCIVHWFLREIIAVRMGGPRLPIAARLAGLALCRVHADCRSFGRPDLPVRRYAP